MIEYTGYIKKIRFYSESSNYIVALIEVEQEDKLITMRSEEHTSELQSPS